MISKELASSRLHPNWLYVVGCGLQGRGQFTIETINIIREADIVLHVVGGGLTEEFIEELNPNLQSLRDCYAPGKPRFDSYFEMVHRISGQLRSGRNVCALFYGHPGVFAFPSHESIRWARENGYFARMLPGISAEDALFADVGIDPASAGCQSYEATNFVLTERVVDPSAALILWQVGLVGDADYQPGGFGNAGLDYLIELLLAVYSGDHKAIIYEAATLPLTPPRIEPVALKKLESALLSSISTLYIPPERPAVRRPGAFERLKLDPSLVCSSVSRARSDLES